MVLFTLQFLVAVTTPVEAAPRTPKITSIELNLDEGTMIITGRYFAWGDKFRGKVLLHLAETGPMTLNVDSYAKLQLTDGVPVRLDQLQVSGIPQNIDEFSGVHLLEVRRRYREQVDGVSVVRYKTGTSLVTIGSEGSVGPEGEKGEKGEQGEQGEQGPAGLNGVGISSAGITKNGDLILTLSDGTEINAGSVRNSSSAGSR